MDKIILKAIDKLIRTLQKVGFIKDVNITNLYTISFVDKLYKSPYFYKCMTTEDKQFFNNLVQCLSDNSCLFDNVDLPELTAGEATTNDAIITILEEYITTQLNEINVPISGGTKKFTDFAYKPYVDVDNSVYVVGYDSDENQEVRLNVTDLGLYWE